jgi:AcrR family transcriptional regulator
LLRAAQTCFLERGYRHTTTRMIADRAGLTERTLFNLFPSKAELFRDAVAAAVSELGEGGRVRDMPEVRDLAAAPDLASFLHSFAGTTARLHQRSAPYAAVTLQAAAADEAAAELWRWGKREQERDVRAVVSLLVNRAWLPESRVDDAVDAILMLTSHETYAQLRLERGWPESRYTNWLMAHLHLEIAPRC